MLLPFLLLISGIVIQPHSKVEIATVDAKGVNSGGSGIVIAKNRILTAYHVVKDVKFAKATCGEKIISTRAVAASNQLDLAVIEYVENCDTIPVTLAEEDAAPGSDLYIAGFPSQMGGLIVTRGIVSGYNFSEKKVPQMWSDVGSWYGNSGGGALDEDGNLIGIVLSIKSLSQSVQLKNDLDIDYQKFTCLAPLSSIKLFLTKVNEKTK